MKQVALLLTILQFYLTAFSQTLFFQSSQSISSQQLASFYASVNLENDIVLFNAPDYKLYAYDRSSGREKWVYPLGRKSDIPPFFAGGFVWATNGDKKVIKLDPQTGKCLKTLEVSSIETQPFIKDGMLFFTGLYDGGNIIAYDLSGDSVKWKRFLAHGYSITHYYLSDRIVANAEGNHWIELNYDGTLTARGCEWEEGAFPSELPCARQFNVLTHDGQEIKGKTAAAVGLDENSVPVIATTEESTFILHDGVLHALGRKAKKKFSLQLNSLADTLVEDPDNPSTILKADEENIYLLYNNHFISYNHRTKKLLKMLSLEQWVPHRVLFDKDSLWMVSKRDGILYGIVVN